MFRFVLFVVLAVGYIESITIDEVYSKVKLLEYSVAQLKAQNEALQNRDVELEMKLRESAEELRRELDQDAWKEQIFMKHSHSADGSVIIPDLTPNLISSTISTIYNNNNNQFGAARATDGLSNSFASTNFETTPVFTAKLDGRFKGITLNIVAFTHFSCDLRVYTIHNGVETLCAELNQDTGRYTSEVECASGGTGFKITSNNKSGKLLRLIIYEITMDITI